MSKNDKQANLYEKAEKSPISDDLTQRGPFGIYADQLFSSLYGNEVPGYERSATYDVFINVLKDWISKSQPFNSSTMKRDVARRLNAGTLDTYTVYFGVPLKKMVTIFPIKRVMSIHDVQFRRIDFAAISKVANSIYIKSLVDEYSKLHHTDSGYAMRNDYVYFKATVKAFKSVIAVNKVSWAFGLFTASVAVAQERFTEVSHYGIASVKSRKPIRTPYLYYLDVVSKNPESDLFIGEALEQSLPDEPLTFMQDSQKIKIYRRYLHILSNKNPTPIDKRIRDCLLEFDQALDAFDAHLRALALWRCLETATRTCDGSARKEKDIIAIVAAYAPGDAWKEQGQIILKSRNLFVHEGESFNSQNRDSHLIWLQDYASAILGLLLWMKEHKIGVTTLNEIDDFFDLYPKSIQSLRVASKMLRPKLALDAARTRNLTVNT